MAKMWTYFFVMLWMVLLIGTGVHLFSKGFLLSRHVQIEKNQCIRLKPCEWNENEVNHDDSDLFFLDSVSHFNDLLIDIVIGTLFAQNENR